MVLIEDEGILADDGTRLGGRKWGAKVDESPPKVGYPVDLIWVTVGSL